MFGDLTVVRLGFVHSLNQVIPGVPLPDDFPGCLTGWADFENAVGQEVASYCFGNPASGDCFLRRLLVPRDHKHVAVGHVADVVMRPNPLGVERVVPKEFAVPGELLNPPAGCSTTDGTAGF